MTDDESLAEIGRLEGLLAAAKCGAGVNLARSARECHAATIAAHRKAEAASADCAAAKAEIHRLQEAVDGAEGTIRRLEAEVEARKREIVRLRRIVRGREYLKGQEEKARIRMEEKVGRLAEMAAAVRP